VIEFWYIIGRIPGCNIHLKHSQLYSCSVPSLHHRCENIALTLVTIASYRESLSYSWANFSVDQIIMASQKMALLAVAGVLCLSVLLNGAEASVSDSDTPLLSNATQASGVSASNSWKLIDTLRTSSCWTDESLPVWLLMS
jgi:hypothetical protein